MHEMNIVLFVTTSSRR